MASLTVLSTHTQEVFGYRAFVFFCGAHTLEVVVVTMHTGGFRTAVDRLWLLHAYTRLSKCCPRAAMSLPPRAADNDDACAFVVYAQLF